MIRIQLQPRSRRFVPLLLLGLGLFLVSTLGLSYLAWDERPSLLPRLAVVEVPRPEPGAEAPALAEAPREKAPALPPVQAPALVKAPPAEETGPPQRKEAKALPPPAQRLMPAKTQTPALPVSGPLCLRILQLHERLPAAVRCTSLSGTGGGEYTIEGSIPEEDFPQLIALLDGLLRLPSRATMSNWREGKKEGDFGFNLHGQFPAAAQPALAPLGTAEAQGLFTQAAALARKSRLDSVRVGSPLFTPVGKGVAQQRQKLWATGSYQQLKSFVETLVRQQPQLRLEEVMLVPHYKGEVQWKQAQFYAVLSTAVRAAR